MKRFAFLFFSFFIFFFRSASISYAAACDASFDPSVGPNEAQTITIDLPNNSGLNPGDIALCSSSDGIWPDIGAYDPPNKFCYRVSMCQTDAIGPGGCSSNSWYAPTGQSLINNNSKIEVKDWKSAFVYTFKVEMNDKIFTSGFTQRSKACNAEWKVDVVNDPARCDVGTFQVTRGSSVTDPVVLSFDGSKTYNFVTGEYSLNLQSSDLTTVRKGIKTLGAGGDHLAWNGFGGELTGTLDLGRLAPGRWEFVVTGTAEGYNYCKSQFLVNADEVSTPDKPISSVPFALCKQVAPEDYAACTHCIGGKDNIENPDDAGAGLWTAFGCVRTSKEGMISDIITIGLMLSGGVVILTILYGAFLLTTSSGDPKRVQEGQEMVTSAIMGLLFVIFSMIILRFIGVDILRIPGFGV